MANRLSAFRAYAAIWKSGLNVSCGSIFACRLIDVVRPKPVSHICFLNKLTFNGTAGPNIRHFDTKCLMLVKAIIFRRKINHITFPFMLELRTMTSSGWYHLSP
jgi:hypothetical protein